MLKIELIRFKPQDIVTASTLNPSREESIKNDTNTPIPVPGGNPNPNPVTGSGA